MLIPAPMKYSPWLFFIPVFRAVSGTLKDEHLQKRAFGVGEGTSLGRGVHNFGSTGHDVSAVSRIRPGSDVDILSGQKATPLAGGQAKLPVSNEGKDRLVNSEIGNSITGHTDGDKPFPGSTEGNVEFNPNQPLHEIEFNPNQPLHEIARDHNFEDTLILWKSRDIAPSLTSEEQNARKEITTVKNELVKPPSSKAEHDHLQSIKEGAVLTEEEKHAQMMESRDIATSLTSEEQNALKEITTVKNEPVKPPSFKAEHDHLQSIKEGAVLTEEEKHAQMMESLLFSDRHLMIDWIKQHFYRPVHLNKIHKEPVNFSPTQTSVLAKNFNVDHHLTSSKSIIRILINGPRKDLSNTVPDPATLRIIRLIVKQTSGTKSGTYSSKTWVVDLWNMKLIPGLGDTKPLNGLSKGPDNNPATLTIVVAKYLKVDHNLISSKHIIAPIRALSAPRREISGTHSLITTTTDLRNERLIQAMMISRAGQHSPQNHIFFSPDLFKEIFATFRQQHEILPSHSAAALELNSKKLDIIRNPSLQIFEPIEKSMPLLRNGKSHNFDLDIFKSTSNSLVPIRKQIPSHKAPDPLIPFPILIKKRIPRLLAARDFWVRYLRATGQIESVIPRQLVVLDKRPPVRLPSNVAHDPIVLKGQRPITAEADRSGKYSYYKLGGLYTTVTELGKKPLKAVSDLYQKGSKSSSGTTRPGSIYQDNKATVISKMQSWSQSTQEGVKNALSRLRSPANVPTRSGGKSQEASDLEKYSTWRNYLFKSPHSGENAEGATKEVPSPLKVSKSANIFGQEVKKEHVDKPVVSPKSLEVHNDHTSHKDPKFELSPDLVEKVKKYKFDQPVYTPPTHTTEVPKFPFKDTDSPVVTLGGSSEEKKVPPKFPFKDTDSPVVTLGGSSEEDKVHPKFPFEDTDSPVVTLGGSSEENKVQPYTQDVRFETPVSPLDRTTGNPHESHATDQTTKVPISSTTTQSQEIPKSDPVKNAQIPKQNAGRVRGFFRKIKAASKKKITNQPLVQAIPGWLTQFKNNISKIFSTIRKYALLQHLGRTSRPIL